MVSGRLFLISVALGSAVLGVVAPFSWHYFSVQAYKEKLAAQEASKQRERGAKAREEDEKHRTFWEKYASEIRRLEKQARAGEKLDYLKNTYPFLKDTSPLEVVKWKDYDLREMDDDDVLEIYRSWLYPRIPKDQFHIWGRDPFGQEKIDAAQKAADTDP
jgi:hypothetical protein